MLIKYGVWDIDNQCVVTELAYFSGIWYDSDENICHICFKDDFSDLLIKVDTFVYNSLVNDLCRDIESNSAIFVLSYVGICDNCDIEDMEMSKLDSIFDMLRFKKYS